MIFNDGTHKEVTDKEVRDDRQLWLEHGKPMIFGKNKDKGIVLRGTKLEVVTIGENGITEKDILVHDETTENTGIHMMLAQMRPPEFPMAFGVIRAYKQPTYNQLFEKQMQEAQENAKIKCVDDLLNSGETWEVK